MGSSKLRSIRILLSKFQPASIQLFGVISSLLNQDPNSRIQSDRITISSNTPVNAQPSLIIELGQVGFPKIIFDTDERIYFHIGHLFVKSSALELQTETIPLASRMKKDSALATEELYKAFRGHVVRLDHAGIDIPAALFPQNSWQTLLSKIGPITNLYQYPNCDRWHFIIPANQAEYDTDITRFTGIRAPKFELVYDDVNTLPAIQFAIQTDLTRSEIETRLPEPTGFVLPETDTCRSVLIGHPWPNLNIRFDFFYKSANPNTEWDTGKWLVMEGKRFRQDA